MLSITYDGAYPELGLTKGYGDLFAFGRPFIANPDLPERIANNWPLNEADPATMYGGTDSGYSDYPYYQK